MVKRYRVATRVLVAALAVLAGLGARSHGEDTGGQHIFDGFLYAGSDDHVWLGTTMATLGMWATCGGIREYRLVPALKPRFAPLVNPTGDLRDSRRIFPYTAFLRGHVTIEQTPRVRVRLRARYRLAGVKQNREKIDGEWMDLSEDQTFELMSVRLLHAEIVPQEWMMAWRRLDQALVEIVDASLDPPSPAKRLRLAQAIERGSQALGVVGIRPIADTDRDRVRQVEPSARVVGLFRRHAPREWRRHLEQFASRLRIRPQTPLPPAARDVPGPELLVGSESPGELLAKVKQGWSEEAIEERLLYSRDLKRVLYVYEVAGMSPDQFQGLRQDAKRQLADRERWERKAKAKQAPDSRMTVEGLGVVISAPSADLLAEKMVLAGILVAQASRPRAGVPLKAGDLVLNYKSVYDLAMGAGNPGRALNQFAQQARHASRRTWRVLRGDRVIMVAASPQR